ncbi:MAG: hypothetical protein JSV03_17545 [Planctomycetota bacterium]|nr:MAG: hypothetical protein JSV03_17545 [Planctomycetota bacterium]
MDLNGIKSRAQKVKAPQAESGARVRTSSSLDKLTARLQAADQQEQSGLRKAAPLFAFAAALLFFVLVVTSLLPSTSPSAGDVVFRVVVFANFLLITVLLLRKLRHLSEIDYAAPMRQFLEATERRYRFMRPWDYLIIIVGCVLLGSVTGIHVVNVMMERYFGPEHLTLIIVSYCVFFTGLCVMGLVFTYLNWKRDKRQLWLEIRQTLAEFSDEETGSTPTSSESEVSRS